MIFRDLTLGQYVALASPLHALDPRTKLFLTGGLMLIGLIADSLGFYLILTLLLALAVHFSGVPLTLLWRNLKTFRWLFAITFCTHLLFTGEANPSPGLELPWPLTLAGAYRGALLSLRLAVMVMVANLLTLTTAPTELTDGLERLMRPFTRFGLPAHELAMMTMIALRFIPTLTVEAERIMNAQMARGADFTGSPLRRARRLLPLLTPLMVAALQRADELAIAMEARCYHGSEGRSQMEVLGIGKQDYWALVLGLGGVLTAWYGGRW